MVNGKAFSFFFDSQFSTLLKKFNYLCHDQNITMMAAVSTTDWRIRLFGPQIQLNQKMEISADQINDIEAPHALPTVSVSTIEAFDSSKYDYIAVFLGADYCPHCKAFAPTVHQSTSALEKKRCKVVFVSNDRTLEAFHTSCQKNRTLDVMPYDLEKTQTMRDLFGLQTIPALMILRNSGFDQENPTVLSNGRQALLADPQGAKFPWSSDSPSSTITGTKKASSISAWERLWIHGKYGNWWELGHHSNPEKPDQIYMDEHAVRIRAGILNTVSWVAIINIFFWKESLMLYILYPIVAWEFILSSFTGLTPLAPIGTLSTLLAIVLQPEPHWKPAKPKRFAWMIGLSLATTCLIIFLFRKELGPDLYRPLMGAVAFTCNAATWLESSAGFCIGCYIYNTFLVPMYNLEECSECKL
jgi:thiol-disulfide isomerase/thioredoxin